MGGNQGSLLLWSCSAFTCVLSAYFVLLPVREDAAITFGTKHLPALFTASLGATLLVAPCVACIMHTLSERAKGLRYILQTFAASLLVLYILSLLTRQPHRHLHPCISAALYVIVNLMNLISSSALWTLCAACYTPQAAKKEYGLLSAGATAGQLLGSSTSFIIVRIVPSAWLQRIGGTLMEYENFGCFCNGGPASMLLLSAVIMLVASHCVKGMAVSAEPPVRLLQVSTSFNRSTSLSRRPSKPSVDDEPLVSSRFAKVLEYGKSAWSAMVNQIHHARSVLSIVATSYHMLLVCAYMGLSSMASSMVYFERAVVVSSQLRNSQSRLTFFASLNSVIGSLILILQLSATAPLLRLLGVRLGLIVSPSLCLLGFAVIAWRPTPNVVAGLEVCRKLVQYSLTRPTREMLFTVMSKEELSAKVVIDSLVGRMADVLAASLFHILDVRLHQGPAALAITSCFLSIAWLIIALLLGASFQTRQSSNLKSIPSVTLTAVTVSTL